MNIQTETFKDIECVLLKTDDLELLIARQFGPRIIALRSPGGSNLLAEIPDKIVTTPYGDFKFYGGHRLWHAPEAVNRTYIPDDIPPEITPIENEIGVSIRQSVETMTHIQKSIRITVEGKAVKLEHKLINRGVWPVELAPWAITMLPPGGTGVFPQTTRRIGGSNIRPNRALIFWPYTNPGDNRFSVQDYVVHVKADTPCEECEAFKFGYANVIGWMGYYNPEARTWFIKTHQHQQTATYPDMGCSAECYLCNNYIELETLGPMVKLEPGQSTTHLEVWSIRTNIGFDDLAKLI